MFMLESVSVWKYLLCFVVFSLSIIFVPLLIRRLLMFAENLIPFGAISASPFSASLSLKVTKGICTSSRASPEPETPTHQQYMSIFRNICRLIHRRVTNNPLLTANIPTPNIPHTAATQPLVFKVRVCHCACRLAVA